ncbi:mannose-6-phosphate isomerase, class I [Bacillus wiedmannii]|uniref:mannose-6-phosphate isomerase, class I n=1 Tax=Bacillus wiedmannii TaxID=1890302 RepID=UPI000B436523|nr:mannose-6-phosphate isomerase, class I [Bacillus wiedmannii]OUB83072.1 mannose-6-phosphate isomerase, class I [Bacillus thuringiensis serovar sinensis]MCU5114354.1 mannose-6-phosphate isomerase, class I [Bacillus wiedmannii]MCU5154163.1 mannose-6-phosphate isomerase, class I [Bacillus wiedmannii]MCU5413883.1 mannose-6-phosphate isomerase, class I [Bacillus wiedmannii]PGD83605.1 mannose-6-phosphate isomerase, class I [Bacillus wiedmannii]
MKDTPLFLQPVLQDRIWGGSNLKQFGYELLSDSVGECWGISAHQNGASIIRNGIYKGYTIQRLWDLSPEIFGCYDSEKFPLLTKILDANKDLSIQVHPNDEFAQINENGELGKTECWYIIDCKDDAEIVYGHYAKTKDEFKKMIANGKWTQLLRRIPIKPGDFFYVPSGTIHALCEGTLVLETQQSSDTTYRVYDYDRMDQAGDKRELHLDKAIEVSSIPHEDYKIELKVINENGCNMTTYIKGKYFSVYKWEIKEVATIKQEKHFRLVSVIDGEAILSTVDGDFPIRKGDHFILPAKMEDINIAGNVTAIVSHP